MAEQLALIPVPVRHKGWRRRLPVFLQPSVWRVANSALIDGIYQIEAGLLTDMGSIPIPLRWFFPKHIRQRRSVLCCMMRCMRADLTGAMRILFCVSALHVRGLARRFVGLFTGPCAHLAGDGMGCRSI